MIFRATFQNKAGTVRYQRFQYDYDATALVEPYARSLAHDDESFLGVVREPSPPVVRELKLLGIRLGDRGWEQT